MQIKKSDFWNNDRNHFLFQRLFLNEQEKWFRSFFAFFCSKRRRSRKRFFYSTDILFVTRSLQTIYYDKKCDKFSFHSFTASSESWASHRIASTNFRHSITINPVGFGIFLQRWLSRLWKQSCFLRYTARSPVSYKDYSQFFSTLDALNIFLVDSGTILNQKLLLIKFKWL